jgi:hypothetical protein
MIVGVAVGEVTPGYELWHPNREKADVITTKFVIAFLMLATAVIAGLVTIGGFSQLSGGGGMGALCLIFALLYAFFSYLVARRWSRGILPVAASLSTILAIFCAVGANSWFARDKAGFEDALIPVSLIGLLVIILLLLQIVLVVACFYGFSQNWHVEEERPIGSGEDYGAGAPPSPDAPQPA